LFGPGESLPDATEGITDPNHLPKAKLVARRRNFRSQPCPRCGHRWGRPKAVTRKLHQVGDLSPGRPRSMPLTNWPPPGTTCRKYVNADMSDLAAPEAH